MLEKELQQNLKEKIFYTNFPRKCARSSAFVLPSMQLQTNKETEYV